MASIYTRAELEALIALWKEAEKKLAARQSYTIGDRSLTATDLPEVMSRIKDLTAELSRLGTGGAIVMEQGVAIP